MQRDYCSQQAGSTNGNKNWYAYTLYDCVPYQFDYRYVLAWGAIASRVGYTPSRFMRPLVGWLAFEIRLKSAWLASHLKSTFNDFLQVPGAVGRCGTKNCNKLNEYCLLFVNKCRLLVALASLTQQCILAYFLQEKAWLKFNFNGVPMAVWRVFRLAMACKFFGGLTMWVGWRRLSTESAGVGEKRRWLTGLEWGQMSGS